MEQQTDSQLSSGADDRYSRLYALERMGVLNDYKSLRTLTILIVGVGGIGSCAAEMLTRCGIGKLILFDYDRVEMANMNRLFYTPKQLGNKKVHACMQTLNAINPEVVIESHFGNVSTDYDVLLNRILFGGVDSKQIALLLCCVDNYGARVTISQACNETNQTWINSGVAENAMSGQIQMCVPGYSACFLCAPPLVVSTREDESTIKRALVCTASLPTTMAIVAGLLVQNSLKFLLHFGDVSWCLGYNSMNDFFPSFAIAPNKDCNDMWCLWRQQSIDGSREEFPPKRRSEKQEKPNVIEHESNEWGISVIEQISFVEESGVESQSSLTNNSNTVIGEYALCNVAEQFRNLMKNQ
ncbi:ThiF family protein [Cardiosporidium cionae]|uniref:Ubiquitin-like modifier-activating enzyme 5 n=1 Tax=Cardiosporidium cionae TaxID=476202 RepID=A0ABQ7J974_9APIC|nr:ThiF family protein [Cardiosporidium cionae]|eukprot:KAF8820552.1 ThiF family protein [Cardiosporidium cionae]